MSSRPPAIDTGMLVARLKRLTGRHQARARLEQLVGIPARRIESIASSSRATPAEEKRLVAALESIGGTLAGLKR